jgi:ArsR family transcriptional regulator, lead/cadmium/zinc/bismuth-responsive transcriptional repressor
MSNHSNDDLCQVTCVNKRKVAKVQKLLPSDPDLHSLSDLFKAFADPTRLKILMALSVDELCVCDIASIAGMSQSAISHQLRFLRISRLIKNRKDGKMVYYSLDDDHIQRLLDDGFRHVREDR